MYQAICSGLSEWLLFNAKSAIFQLYHGGEQVNFQWDDDEVRFELDQHAELVFYSASSLKPTIYRTRDEYANRCDLFRTEKTVFAWWTNRDKR